MMSTMPMSRSMAVSPRSRRMRSRSGDAIMTSAVAVHAIRMAPSQVSSPPGSLLARRMTIAMADGPAIKGMASGTMNGSPASAPPPITPSCLKNHAQADDAQDDAPGNRNGFLLQTHDPQDGFTEVKKENEYAEGDYKLPEQYFAPAALLHIFQEGKRQRHIPERVHHKKQEECR